MFSTVSSSRPPLLCSRLAEKITLKCFPSSEHSKQQQNFWPYRKQHWCHPDGSLPDADIRLELGVEPILLSVETTQLRWFGHVLRMYTNRMARWICTGRTTMDTVERPTNRTVRTHRGGSRRHSVTGGRSHGVKGFLYLLRDPDGLTRLSIIRKQQFRLCQDELSRLILGLWKCHRYCFGTCVCIKLRPTISSR